MDHAAGTSGTAFVLDSGALIAFERNHRQVRALVRLAAQGQVTLSVSAGAVAQVWRGGPRQAWIARLLSDDALREEPLDPPAARQVGLRCGLYGTTDVVDAHAAVLADRLHAPVMTSDPDDLAALGIGRERIVPC